MAFETTSLDDQHDFAIALFRALHPDLDVSELSHNWKWLRTQAGGTFGNQAHISATRNDVMPDTATGDMADRWGNIRGVKRKTAAPASKPAALRFTGTAGTSIPDQMTLTHQPSGLQFRTVGAAAVGATGTVDVGVIAIDVGSKTRLNAGETLTLQSGISGLQDDAELQLALDQGGDDAELDGDYVPRYLQRFKNPPLGGTVVLVADGAGDVPMAGVSTIYSGGPLVQPARLAVQTLFDSLGTANPDTSRYGPWEGNLRPNAIGRVITGVPGVLDIGAGGLIAPASTVVASDPISNPTDSTIGLLIASRILIRKEH